MNIARLLLSSLAWTILSLPATAAESPRLALWITEPIGTSSGIQCNFADADSIKLPVMAPTLTEQNVSAWERSTARWTIDAAMFASTAELEEHCFILAIDGKAIESGAVLANHTARLTGYPTLSVIHRDKVLDLQLLSSNHGSHMRLKHVDALDSVLGSKPAPQK